MVKGLPCEHEAQGSMFITTTHQNRTQQADEAWSLPVDQICCKEVSVPLGPAINRQKTILFEMLFGQYLKRIAS